MEKSSGIFGISVTGLAMAAVFTAFFGGRAGTAPAAGPAAAPPASAPEPPRPRDVQESPPFDRGEMLLRAYFGRKLGGKPCTGKSCHTLDILVATVPDPYDSRLDWSYDAQVESLRRAHETAGFVIDRFWLPPNGDSVAVAEVGDSVPRRHVHPGVILFRSTEAKQRRLRLLYLVGETPTAGVHRRALENALAERASLLAGRNLLRAERPGDSLRIVGPVFSGSAGSLGRTLAELLPRRQWASLVSGSATDSANRTRLTLANRERIAFRATVNTDDALESALNARVLRPLGISPGEVAVLRESSTQYGLTLARRGRDSSLVIPFPMNISSVRREYERNPEARGAGDPRIPGQPGASSRVALTLQDGPRPREAPPTVSPQITPAAAELMMDEIVATLRRHGVRMVGVQATDVRDKLFLAEHLRRRMRDVRLYTYESNALYLRGDRNASLRGMLVLSSYPLVLENQWWSDNPGAGERIAFTSDAALGTYNAALLHLGHPRAVLESQRPFARDTLPDPLPPVWIAAVGTRSFLPLDTWSGADRLAEVSKREREPASPAALAILVVLGLGLVGMSGASLWGTLRRYHELSVLRLDRTERSAAAARKTAAAAASVASPAAAAASGPKPPVETPVAAGVAGEERTAPTAQAGTAPAAVPAAPPQVEVGRGFRFLPDFGEGEALAEAREEVHHSSLLMHRELYTALRLVAAAGVFLPPLVLLWMGSPAASLPGWLALASVAVAWGAAMTASVVQLARLFRTYSGDGLRYALRRGSWSTLEGWAWRFEVAGRTFVVALGAFYALLTLGYVADVWAISRDGARFGLYLHRAGQLGSGLSPLVPLLATGAGFTLWSLWHLQRIARLSETTAFELACLSRAGKGARRDSECAEDRIACAVRDVRDRLFLLVPHPRGMALLAFMTLLVAWLLPQFGRTLESIALPPSARGGASWFDWLFRFSVSATLVATAWAVYRLMVVWSALQRCLYAVEETPLLGALAHIPAHVARLTRMTVFGRYHTYAVDALVAQRWAQLRDIHKADPEAARQVTGHDLEAEKLPGETTGRMWRVHIWDPRARTCGERFEKVLTGLCTLWNGGTHPSHAAPAREETVAEEKAGETKTEEAKTEETTAKAAAAAETAPAPDPAARWRDAAESFVAVQFVEYVQGVLQQFRNLAFFLFASLLLTTVLISSYPFQPQSLVKLVFLCVLLATVGSLLLVMAQMNADPVLSQIAKTDPGRVNWDGPFVLNGLLVAVVPLLTLVSSEYPALRTVLFAWVDPVLKAFSGG